MSKRSIKVGAAVVVASLGMAVAPAAIAPANAAATTINYVLWDDRQQPAYQKCADAFHVANPDITVKITQMGWDDYWTAVNTELNSGSGKIDVFTDHLAFYKGFLDAGQIIDISKEVAAAKVDTKQYKPGLLDLWSKNGGIYGLPKDFDTIALAYDSTFTRQHGVTDAQMKALTWNAKDGGTYEQILKKLTVDSAGNNALSPKFNKNKVVTYALAAPDATSAWGQTDWSGLAFSNGFQFLDKNPWGSKYYYDSPKLAQVLAWYQKGILGGWIMDPRKTGNLGTTALWNAGKIVMATKGSWEITDMLKVKDGNIKFVQQPAGPLGVKTMYNGLADSVVAKTKNRDAAVKWVLFTGSTACQDLVAAAHVVFPAIDSSFSKAKDAFKGAGVDLSGFTDEAVATKTMIPPISDVGQKVGAIWGPVLQRIFYGQTQGLANIQKALTAVNKQLNALF